MIVSNACMHRLIRSHTFSVEDEKHLAGVFACGVRRGVSTVDGCGSCHTSRSLPEARYTPPSGI